MGRPSGKVRWADQVIRPGGKVKYIRQVGQALPEAGGQVRYNQLFSRVDIEETGSLPDFRS